VMQRSWSIQSGFAWHAMQLAKKGATIILYSKLRPLLLLDTLQHKRFFEFKKIPLSCPINHKFWGHCQALP
jgi:hypothetical protein